MLTVKRKQQTFHDEQWVMFTANPREKMQLGQVLYTGNPLTPKEYIGWSGSDDWLIVCGLYTPNEHFYSLYEVVYIRPPTEKELFIGCLNGEICEDD